MKWMKVSLMMVLSVGMLWMVGCGDDDDDSPTAPSSNELVGSWRFESNNMVEVFFEAFAELFREFGATDEEIQEMVEEMEADDSFGTGVLTLREDGTYVVIEEEEETDTGTWEVKNNKLVISDGEDEFAFTYSLSGNKLTLTIPPEEFASDEEEVGFTFDEEIKMVLIRED